MNRILSAGRISFRELQVRIIRVLMARLGKLATILVDIFIIISPLLFLTVQVIFHLINTGYNPVEETISMYVWCEYGIAQSIVLLLQSAAMLALTARLYFILRRIRRVKWGLGIFALIALGMLVVAICPTREYGAPVTPLVIAHIGSALTICGLFPLALILTASAFKLDQYWRSLYRFCLYIAAVAIVVGLAGLAIILTDIPGLGIIERILMVNSALWMFVLGAKLLYHSLKNFNCYGRRPGSINAK